MIAQVLFCFVFERFLTNVFSCPNTRNLEVVDTATYNLEKWKINRIIPVGWRKTGKLIKGLLKAGQIVQKSGKLIEPFLMAGKKSGKLMDNKVENQQSPS